MLKVFCITVLVSLALVFNAFAEKLLIVGENEITDAIKTEFAEQGLDEKLDLEFFGGQTSFHIEGADNYKIMVMALKFDELQNKFGCALEIFADGKSYAKTGIQGKYHVIADVYVPAEIIRKGDIITRDKLKQISVRSSRVKPVFVTDAEKLVGKEAKKTLKEGKLVSAKDIGAKVLIKKGDVVTVIYKTDRMQITAKAEALEDGAEGDKIELLNTKSQKALYGEVLNADTVEVEQQ